MSSIEETAQVMFGLGKMNPMTIIQAVKEINSIISVLNRKSNDISGKIEQSVNFTGQHTDIAFVAEKGSLKYDIIENIQNDSIRNNVQSSFNDAVRDGYLNYNNETKEFILTPKGNEHINSEQFIRQFEKDQLNKASENKAYVTLKGNSSDLGVFRYTDRINLNHLSHSDPSTFKRVQSYFYECQKYDFVNISPDGIVTPTKKCHEYLKSTNQNIDITKLSKENIRDISQRFSESAAKKATNEAAKKAASRSAANATGAATGGVGVAVSAVVNLTSKGADSLTKLETQNHKSKIKT